MPKHSQYLIGHLLDVPEVHLQGMCQDLRNATLFADQHRNIVAQGLQGDQAKGFRNGGHDKEIRHAKDLVHGLSLEKSCEMNLVTDAHGRGLLNHAVGHIPGTCHEKLHVVHFGQDAPGSLQKVFRALLHGNPS